MSKLRHSESGKFEKVPTRTVKTIPFGDEKSGVKGVRYSNDMGAIVKMDFTGDTVSKNSPVNNDLGRDTSLGADVPVHRNLHDGNSAPSAVVRNLPPHSNVRGRNNKNWDVVR